jgi:hypothetical protein
MLDYVNGYWMILYKQKYWVNGDDETHNNELAAKWAQMQVAGELKMGRLCPKPLTAAKLVVITKMWCSI